MPREKTCIICNNSFEVKPVYYARSKYCSINCAAKAKQNQQQRKCKNCFKTFMFKPSQLNKYPNAGRYCSRNCGYEYRVKINALKPSTDRYDRTRRIADVKWQKSVRNQDNFMCRRCNKYDLYIHTHHLAPRSTRPDLKHDVTNGICLCASCHLWVHHHPKLAIENGWLISSGSN